MHFELNLLPLPLSQLEQVIKANRPSPQKAAESKQAAANVESGFEADAIFPGLGEAIKADPAMVKRINGVYEFNITGKNNTKTVWTVDLKNAPGSVSKGPAAKPDCKITVSDVNFIKMISGKANGQQLFMSGKIKFQGNLSLAMKLEQLFKAKANL